MGSLVYSKMNTASIFVASKGNANEIPKVPPVSSHKLHGIFRSILFKQLVKVGT